MLLRQKSNFRLYVGRWGKVLTDQKISSKVVLLKWELNFAVEVGTASNLTSTSSCKKHMPKFAK